MEKKIVVSGVNLKKILLVIVEFFFEDYSRKLDDLAKDFCGVKAEPKSEIVVDSNFFLNYRQYFFQTIGVSRILGRPFTLVVGNFPQLKSPSGKMTFNDFDGYFYSGCSADPDF